MYKIRSIKQIIFNKYATNLKTTIFQRTQVCSLLFEFNNYSFLIDIIDNIIYTSGLCHQNSNQWQCSIIVTCLPLYHVISILHCHWRKLWSHDTDVFLTYIGFFIILTQFYVTFSRQEHQIDFLQVSLKSWDSQVSAYTPFHFSFTIPLSFKNLLKMGKMFN